MKLLMRRREFIKRMGLTSGALFLGPLLDKLIAEAQADCNVLSKKRIIFYDSGGAFFSNRFVPSPASGGNSFGLPAILSPLAPYQNEMILVRNLYQNVFHSLHGSEFSFYNGFPNLGPEVQVPPNGLNPSAPSIDTILSRELGNGTQVREMAVGYGCTSYFADAYNMQKKWIVNLTDSFNQYIAGRSVNAGDIESRKKRSLLDFAKDDIRRVNRAVASTEKAKLEQYLAAIQDAENAIQTPNTPSGLACSSNYSFPSSIPYSNYTLPVTSSFGGDGIQGCPSVFSDGFCGGMMVHADLVTLAIGCGITRHASMISDPGGMQGFFKALRDANGNPIMEDQHAIAHAIMGQHKDKDGKPIPLADANGKYDTIMKYHASVVARMYKNLKNIPEGGGTAADNTLIVWANALGSDHHDSGGQTPSGASLNIPIVLLGKAGGALRTGQAIDCQNAYSVCQLFYTVAKAMGSCMSQFGGYGGPKPTGVTGGRFDPGNTPIPLALV